MQDLLYRIALTRIPQVGAVTARTLVSYCGSPQAVFETGLRELCRIPGIGESTARHVRRPEVLLEAETEAGWLERHSVRALFYLDEDYPTRLKPLPTSPVLLYVRGDVDLNTPRTVAVIGTRKPTPLGIQQDEDLVADLLPYRPLIISGLAYGIDVVAHRQALEVGLPTLGVLGHGLRRIYPAAHQSVAQRMIGQGGLLTEYPSWVGPEREHFPMRNRIVAGLADALVVVETGRQGGSIITAQFGNDLNKDVFAFPGRTRDPAAAGGNWLIKTHQAALLESADDVAYVLGWEKGAPPARQATLFEALSSEEESVVAVLHDRQAANLDVLQYETKLTGSHLAAVLLELECKGLVRLLPGRRYMLTK